MPVKTGIRVGGLGGAIWTSVFTGVTKADRIHDCEMKFDAAVLQPQCW
jgi:hypothetical protein